MKKALLVAIPVLALLVVGARAHGPERHPMRRAMDELLIGGGGYRIGVLLSEISPHLRDDLKIEGGVLIEEVFENSPAEKAGLREGDILLKLDGEPINDDEDVRRTLRKMEDAKEMTLEILRDGKPLTIPVLPEKRTQLRMIRQIGGSYIGVQLQEMNPDLAKYFQVEPGKGALVTEVVTGSPAEKGGIKAGDVVTEMNSQKVNSPEDLRDQLSDVKEGESVTITVVRHGKIQNLTIQPERRAVGDFGTLQALPKLAELPEIMESPEMKRSMREIEREMEKLKDDLELLKKEEIEKLRSEIQEQMKEVQRQMEEMRKAD